MLADSRNTPMHVGGLQIYKPPPDAGPDYVRELMQSFLDVPQVTPLFSKRPTRGLATAGQWFWTEDTELDLEHHVRHAALPGPAGSGSYSTSSAECTGTGCPSSGHCGSST